MARFTVASNWENSLIEGLCQYPEVQWVFAKLNRDAVGGGRASFALPTLNRKKAIGHIRYVQSKGIKFNYLFNASCLGNADFSKKGMEAIVKELDWVVYEAKVDGMTISTSRLLRLAKNRYPSVPLTAGIGARLIDLDQFRYFEDQGVDSIVLSHSYMLNLKFLKKLRKTVNCRLILIINELERIWCPTLWTHLNSMAHMSKTRSISGETRADPCLWNCSKKKLQNPKEFIKGCFLRPEDLREFEQMGYQDFKIVDRSRATPWLLRAVKAYVSGEYEGNFLDICNMGVFAGRKNLSRSVSQNFFQYFMKQDKMGKEKLEIYFGKFEEGFPKVDNKKLGDWLRELRNGKGEGKKCGKIVYFKNDEKRKELIDVLEKSMDYFISNSSSD